MLACTAISVAVDLFLFWCHGNLFQLLRWGFLKGNYRLTFELWITRIWISDFFLYGRIAVAVLLCVYIYIIYTCIYVCVCVFILWGFHTCTQCVLISSHPNSSCICPLTSFQLLSCPVFLVLWYTEFSLCCSYTHGCGAIDWNMVGLSWTTAM